MKGCNCLQELDRLRLRHEANPKKTHFIVVEFDDKTEEPAVWGHEVSLVNYQQSVVELAREVMEGLDS